MKSPSEISAKEFIDSVEAVRKRVRALQSIQIALIVLSAAGLLTIVAIKLAGGPSKLVIPIGVVVMLCGLGSMIPGRMAQPIATKLDQFREEMRTDSLRRQSAITPAATGETSGVQHSSTIPLTIGFANLSGEDLSPFASADVALLSPLFARSRVVADHEIPSAAILLLYAHLNDDGTIRGQSASSIRQVVQLTNAAIVILASPNTSGSIKNAVALPGPKRANIVFTLDRNGTAFGRFFLELFGKMRDGKDMLSAWVELAPQHPAGVATHAPQTILVAEGGRFAFPLQSAVRDA